MNSDQGHRRRNLAHLLALAGGFAATDAGALELQVDAAPISNGANCPVPRNAATYHGIKRAVECAEDGDVLLLQIGQTPYSGPENRDLLIDKSLTLRGSHAVNRSVLDAQQQGRHIRVVDPDVVLTLEHLTFRNGYIATTVAQQSALGGSVEFRGMRLNVVDCAFLDNTLTHYVAPGGFDLGGAFGGAISAGRGATNAPRGDKISVVNSRFEGNSLSSSGRKSGSAISVENFTGTPEDHRIGLEIDRSSFFGNVVASDIAASAAVITHYDFDQTPAKTVITNTFVSAHSPGSAPVAAADMNLSYSTIASFGGARQYMGSIPGTIITRIGTLFLDFGTGGACYPMESGVSPSLGYNLDNDGTCLLDAATDLPNTTEPHVVLRTSANGAAYVQLEAESPAVNAGAVGCVDTLGRPVLFDQLGNPRPDASPCDIGAYESPFVEEPEEPLPPEIFSDTFEPLSPPP